MNTLNYILSRSARNDLKELMRNRTSLDQIRLLDAENFPPFLYKYTSINQYSVLNLKTNNLTATIPTEFNDLYDSTMHFDTYNKKLKQIQNLNEKAREIGYNKIIDSEATKLLLKNSEEEDNFKLSYLSNGFRITSLSSSNQDIKMWSLYANNNKGICIEYGFRQDQNRISNFIYPVLYIDKPLDVTYICEDDKKLDLAVLSSVISKYKEWEYEREWRIVLYVGYQIKEKRVPIQNIPKPKCIYLGNKFLEYYQSCKKDRSEEGKNETKLLSDFLYYVKKMNISLKIAKPQIRSYVLEFEDIDVIDVIMS
ncbi:DUF2971 domain-containing protein [Halalkalibacter sp. AB-rgal2]|uniref:DUF2971 domain-containing protein n=1 Tax=Halalkalibacter sp. AB-rgal2 TaxID=3242695 RepID=UPI00359D73FD